MENGMAAGEKLEAVGRRILTVSRNELYLKMRFLDVALSSLAFVMDVGAEGLGTDGLFLYFHPQYLGGLYRENRVMVNRIYLHLVLHGIFHHITRRKGRKERLYSLACDIAAESIIDDMQHRCILKSRSLLRRETYRRLSGELKVLASEKVYGVLDGWALSEDELFRLEAEFRVDDHSYWPKEDEQKKQQEIENRWQDVSQRMETEMETFSKEMSSGTGDLIGKLRVENRERFDYRHFLRKFSVLREETAVDEDSFDYVFYTYGFSLYGNMPLVEPLEWKETRKVEEFAVVIDTSMSCSGELVRKFLEETYSVLSESNSFFRRVNIHIIQCDDQVQTDQVITSEEELKEYMEDLELKGEGGTDFGPAFEYVEELMHCHAFGQLKGLIYFTDGKGAYPAKMPPFETAFVFLKDDYEDVDVPPWAMKLILSEDELVK
ncbi:MAG: metallopeptidase [Dorea sp.]|uniref:vWA domain-containing protein n=1 Tax=Sporofaciens musculi TaxID=2681861 RepID=UPI00217401AD|nr:VWA-like domain-containing protein [Sporofaciens musculi]MCI9422534.1 metallopeptidase [Dorea sp.]